MPYRSKRLVNKHSKQGTFWFSCRVTFNRIRRSVINFIYPVEIHHSKPIKLVNLPSNFESRTPLWTSSDPNEQVLTLGKIENLRIALKCWHGVTIPAGKTVSFWRQTGPPTRSNGFVPGRELREGCIVPSPGGGLCQLSNALYDLALQTDCEILERHPHTQTIPGSATSRDRDATVAYNHIDLRFRPRMAITIFAFITKSELVVRFHIINGDIAQSRAKDVLHLPLANQGIQSCATCGEATCFQHRQAKTVFHKYSAFGNAILIDAITPETENNFINLAQPNDQILHPIQSNNPVFARYKLPVTDTRQSHVPFLTVWRALQVRLATTPTKTRSAHLAATKRLAEGLARKIPYTCNKLTIDIAFLPFIDPVKLQGREVVIFLSRFPLKLIHEFLDDAAIALPDCSQLNDFRAPDDYVDREWDALQTADNIITSHPYLANHLKKMGFSTISLTPYVLPPKVQSKNSDKLPYLFFPGPTAARKGAHAVREVALSLNLPISGGGKNFESNDFWQNVQILDSLEYPAQKSLAIIAPGVFEDRPTKLLPFLESNIPIITTAATGLPEHPEIHLAEFNDSDRMKQIVLEIMSKADLRSQTPLF